MWSASVKARLRLIVERAALGGDGIGRAPDGRVVFVRGALPGDAVEVEITEVKRRHLRGRLHALEAPGPDRRQGFCDRADACGGCPWMGLAPEAQRAAAWDHVQHLLRGAGGVGERAGPAVVAVPPDAGWRATARLHWAEGRIGFRPPAAHAVLDLPACPVLSPPVDALYQAVRARLAPALTGRGTLRISADAGPGGGATLALEPAGPASGLARALAGFVAETPACRGAVLLGPGGARRVFGTPEVRLGPQRVVHPADGFLQAHQPGAARLAEDVVAALAPSLGPILELYAGSGYFSFALAAAGRDVVAVELQPAAAAALRAASARWAAEGRPGSVAVIAGDARAVPAGAFEAALVDPPRAGALPALPGLHASPVRRLVYVSCDPATFARDAGWLTARGWRLVGVQGYDLFPHTGHLELLGRFERDGAGGGDGQIHPVAGPGGGASSRRGRRGR